MGLNIESNFDKIKINEIDRYAIRYDTQQGDLKGFGILELRSPESIRDYDLSKYGPILHEHGLLNKGKISTINAFYPNGFKSDEDNQRNGGGSTLLDEMINHSKVYGSELILLTKVDSESGKNFFLKKDFKQYRDIFYKKI